MRLGINTGYSGKTISLPMDMILEADKLGYYAVWTAEAYGSDCVTPLSWIGAQTKQIRLGSGIMQMPARTPAMAAMTALTLHDLTGGRFILGLGASGPQVVEGLHGAPYNTPLTRLRETVEVCRQVFAGEKVEYQGKTIRLPLPAAGTRPQQRPLTERCCRARSE